MFQFLSHYVNVCIVCVPGLCCEIFFCDSLAPSKNVWISSDMGTYGLAQKLDSIWDLICCQPFNEMY